MPSAEQERAATPAPVAERQGSRWVNAQPSEDQVREWFKSQVLHEGMDHDPYMGGIVVIGATEKVKTTKQNASGNSFTVEADRAVFTPYVKVDTRIAYFWGLVRALNDEEVEREIEVEEGEDAPPLKPSVRSALRRQLDGPYVGVIEPVPQARIADANHYAYNANLPEGYSVHVAKNKDGSASRYLVATWRVAIYERESWASRIKGDAPVPLLQGIGSKQTPMAKTWADDNAMMKAETGAIGRALGVAGILVVGTGVATAEDMQEAQSPSGAAGASAEATLPPVVDREGEPVAADQPMADVPAAVDDRDPDDVLRERALALQRELEAEHPVAWEAYKAWWAEREFGPIAQLVSPALKGAVIKLERDLDAARRGASPQGESEA